MYQYARRHLHSIIPAAILGVFFSLPQVSIGSVVGTIVLTYIVAWVVAYQFVMPTAWLHALTVNAIVSMVLAVIVLIKALMKPFPDISNWGNVILLACGIMLLFFVAFAIATMIYWYLEKRTYQAMNDSEQ